MFVATALLVSLAASPAQPFSVRSAFDGFPIHGQTDLPTSGVPDAVVLFLPGSGNHSRDFEYAVRGSGQKSYVFRELSKRLNAAGLATVRYDERGVSCVGKPAPPDDDDRCHDAAAARSITMDALTGDVEALLRHAAAGPGGRCVIALGHSEGFYHTARLVGRGGPRPAGIIGIGAPFDSLPAISRWQFVDRLPEALRASDKNGDDLVTREEFVAYLPSSAIRETVDEIAWPPGFSWPATGLTTDQIMAIRDHGVDRHDVWRKDLLAKDPRDLSMMTIAGKEVPRASFAWWRPFLDDWTPTAAMLSGYDGTIEVFYGTRDSSVDPATQLQVARRLLGKARLRATVTPGVGHALGEHPAFGPMRDDQQDAIVAAARRIAGACKVARRSR